MARRKTSKTRRSSRRKTISISGTAQSLIIGNAMVRGATNANLYEFFTGRTMGPYGSNYSPNVKDNVLTLPELLGMDR